MATMQLEAAIMRLTDIILRTLLDTYLLTYLLIKCDTLHIVERHREALNSDAIRSPFSLAHTG